jgi:hypothetical protein
VITASSGIVSASTTRETPPSAWPLRG